MALILEDGTGSNPNANSYITVEKLRSYADLRGVDLTKLLNIEVERLIVKAMDKLENPKMNFKGFPTSDSQPLKWPRSGVYDVERPGKMSKVDEIPRLLEQGLTALVFEELEGEPEQRVTKRKLGDLEIVYSSDTPKQNFISAFDSSKALLAPLRESNGFGMVRG